MLRRALINSIFFVIVIVALNILYTQTLYKKDLAEKSKEILELREDTTAQQVYYFGESSNITYAPQDSITNSISAITNQFFPDLRIKAVTKYASHAGIYKHWLRELPGGSAKPKAVIITMNLRSFDAAWIHSRLETQLQEALVLTRPYPNIINRFCLSLQAFDNKTEQQREQIMLEEWRTVQLKFPFPFKYKTVREWDDATAAGSHLKPDGSWDNEKIILACHYVKGYAFNLNEENPRVKDFDAISRWCEENHVKLYLNLMAENIQYADSLVGKELVFLMRQNRDFLVKRYNTPNCKVVDNLELVEGKWFIDQNWTTEHYNYKGRMRIAKNLALAMKAEFENNFKSVY